MNTLEKSMGTPKNPKSTAEKHAGVSKEQISTSKEQVSTAEKQVNISEKQVSTSEKSISTPEKPTTAPSPMPQPLWGAVFSVSLGVFALVTAEFLPASLLTPMAADLGVTEGAAGQAVTVTAAVALVVRSDEHTCELQSLMRS